MTATQQPAFPQDAYDLLVERVHAPVFFQKLARDHGINPQTAQERFELLELAGILQNQKAQGQVKAAAQGRSLITEATDGLKTALARDGYDLEAPTSRQRLVKEAAHSAAQQDDIAAAALDYAGYLAALTA